MHFLTSGVLFILLVNDFCFAVSDPKCDEKGVLIYEDIACKPGASDADGCPKSYDCSFDRPKSGCLFKGKNYAVGETIDSDLTYSGCSVACTCNEQNSIICASLDCPEYLNGPLEPNCYRTYSLGKCCSTGKLCNNTADTKTCKVDGETYKLGEKFYPKDTCLICVCHENFTGEYDEETCLRQNCNGQIHYTNEIQDNCAPAFFNYRSKKVLCCPDHYVCSQPTDKIEVVNDKVSQNSGLTCAYGEKKLKLGEGFSRKENQYGEERILKCECVIPPFVTCKQI